MEMWGIMGSFVVTVFITSKFTASGLQWYNSPWWFQRILFHLLIMKIMYLTAAEVRAAPHMDNLVSIYKSMELASGINIFATQNAPSAGKPGKIMRTMVFVIFHLVLCYFGRQDSFLLFKPWKIILNGVPNSRKEFFLSPKMVGIQTHL